MCIMCFICILWLEWTRCNSHGYSYTYAAKIVHAAFINMSMHTYECRSSWSWGYQSAHVSIMMAKNLQKYWYRVSVRMHTAGWRRRSERVQRRSASCVYLCVFACDSVYTNYQAEWRRMECAGKLGVTCACLFECVGVRMRIRKWSWNARAHEQFGIVRASVSVYMCVHQDDEEMCVRVEKFRLYGCLSLCVHTCYTLVQDEHWENQYWCTMYRKNVPKKFGS